jgi:hypothetical protein
MRACSTIHNDHALVVEILQSQCPGIFKCINRRILTFENITLNPKP